MTKPNPNKSVKEKKCACNGKYPPEFFHSKSICKGTYDLKSECDNEICDCGENPYANNV